jgi:hypothetical protein
MLAQLIINCKHFFKIFLNITKTLALLSNCAIVNDMRKETLIRKLKSYCEDRPLTVVSQRTGVEYWALYRIVRETNKRGGKQKNWEKLETFFKGVK